MRADSYERVIEHFLRGLYSAALYLLLPVTVYHLIWRGFRQRTYLLRWDERYARYRYRDQPPATEPQLWVHAVSVGEVNAAAPLINALLRQYPKERMLITTITPTGSERVAALWGGRVTHVYLPYDLTGAVARFLRHFRPRVALIVETELWPNLLFACRDHGVPTYLVNARLSERSLRGYRVLRALVGRALRTMRAVAAQSEADAARFLRLGAREGQVAVCGNLKFDTRVDPGIEAFAREVRARLPGRPVWIAASTHPDEEAAVLAIDRHLRARWPDLLMMWAPRHPERFRPATELAIATGLQVATRQLTYLPDGEDAIFVIDTLGELMGFYACADVAFVGGSLQPVGGHNLLEPASVGTPVVTGPHLHNFSDIAGQLQRAHAVRIGADADAVAEAIQALLADESARQAMAEAGRMLVAQGRGALHNTLAVLAPDLPATPPSRRAPAP